MVFIIKKRKEKGFLCVISDDQAARIPEKDTPNDHL